MTRWAGWSAGRVRELRPGLHTVETRVDDFDVRAALVLGAERALVWDTLAHPAQMADVPLLVGPRRVTVAYSHADWDHVWGTAALSAIDEIVAHERCADRFRAEVPAELARRRAAEAGRWDAVVLRAPTRAFTSGLEVDLGGITIQLAHLPGHTVDCCVAWIPAWGILLAGDTVETPFPLLTDGAALPAWIEALDRWEAEPGLEVVVPSHGSPGGKGLLDSSRAYLAALLEGRAPALGADVPAFYRDAHEENVRLARGPARGRSSPDPAAP